MFTQLLDLEVPNLDKLYIGGAWVEPANGGEIDVISPSTEEVVARVAAPSADDAESAIAAARHAFDQGTWPRMSIEERVAVCTRLCEEMETRLEDMNRAWAYESGAPLAHGAMINSGAAVMVWRHALEIAPTLPWEERRATTMGEVVIRREPVGTALAILTYNGPIILMGMKVIPALLAGCTVIVKPAPESQLTTRLVAESIDAAGFPPGVVSVLAADTEVTQHMTAHPDVDIVSITGGTQHAVDVLKRTADRVGRTVLELGGKAPAIITDDADIETVIETLVPGSTGFCGQVCVSLSRILVPRSRYEEIVAALASRWAELRVGDPFDPEITLGPLGNKRALARTEQFVQVAQEEGAKVVVGGCRPAEFDRGWFYQPTLLRDVDNSMTVAQEEVFGPVTCVIPYDNIDDAVQIANDTRYGLAASVYTANVETGFAIANRIQSGTVAINLAGVCLTEPWGGIKQSGHGRECGAEGMFEFTTAKQILLSGSYLES